MTMATTYQRLTLPLSRQQQRISKRLHHRRFPAGLSSSPSISHIKTTTRNYNFASQQYQKCFGNLPNPNVTSLREKALGYLDKEFNPRLWYDHPVATIINGEKLTNGTPSSTLDAFSSPNGTVLHSNPTETAQLLSHISTYRSTSNDLRAPIRRIENKLLSEYPGFLIGNQLMDFYKQDGVTEIEESIMANEVERRMNDALLDDVGGGRVTLGKGTAAFVGCVSNFSNFLDLCRKVLRNLECGVPIVVLGRGNTTQHSYRWTELLVELLKEEGVDPGMVTYASCELEDVKKLLKEAEESPMYVTCGRELARVIKEGHNKTVSSTGGPNTLVCTEVTQEIKEAVSLSATIESSGQCTALRHAVLPQTDENFIKSMFSNVSQLPKDQVVESLRAGQFAGIIKSTDGQAPDIPDYARHPSHDVWYRISPQLPPDAIDENWRKVVVDVTTTLDVPSLSRWLVRNQPISLAINAKRTEEWPLVKELFEKTSLVVYTVGSPHQNPALTCQARPQEGEVFGEFPPRRELSLHTTFPVVVPSSTPAYDAQYDDSYLSTLSSIDDGTQLVEEVSYVADAIKRVACPKTRGYAVLLANYLADATKGGAKRAKGARTTLWGWQRPPLDGSVTVMRCANGSGGCWDGLLPRLMPFLVTNARGQVEVSLPVSEGVVWEELKRCGVTIVVEDDEAFRKRTDENYEAYYNVVEVTGDEVMEFPMVGQFVSLFLPMGHIKSTMADDSEFWEYFEQSEKWLKVQSSF